MFLLSLLLIFLTNEVKGLETFNVPNGCDVKGAVEICRRRVYSGLYLIEGP